MKRPKWSFKAQYKTRCVVCKLMIQVGTRIKFDELLKVFVHANCVQVQRKRSAPSASVSEASPRVGRDVDSAGRELPHGLKPGETADAYLSQWVRYVSWCKV